MASIQKYLLVFSVIILSQLPIKAQQYLDLPEKKASGLLKKEKGTKPILHFDEKGLCDMESYQYETKAVFDKRLQLILGLGEFEWIKINENQFVSNFKKQRLVEIFEEEPPYQVRILRTAWSKELYDLLLKK